MLPTPQHFVNYSVNIALPNAAKRIISQQDLPTLQQELCEVTWDPAMQRADPSTCCNEVMNGINKIISKFLKLDKKSKRKNIPSASELLC